MLKDDLYNKDNLVLAWLDSQIRLNLVRVNQILAVYQNIYLGIKDKFKKLVSRKNSWLDKAIYPDNLDYELALFKENLQKEEIQITTVLDPNFPKKFKILGNCPVVLYFQGNLELCNSSDLITVVGSRMNSKYADLVLSQILLPLCQNGIGVVSGLALGVDTLAHKIAIDNATTIAIIGSGLNYDSFYPKENWALKNQIISKNGLILSEYPPNTPATIYNFPRRNRLLASLSEITWVIQAGQKSGSLITASIAQDLGKTVATTPGSIFENSVSGNLLLLKNGASIISSKEDVFDLLGLKIHPEIQAKREIEFSSEADKIIYTKLMLTPQIIEDIASNCNFSTLETSQSLSMLELNGLAKNLGNNEWVRLV